MGGCTVPDCKSRGQGLMMFIFPRDPIKNEKWVTAVKQHYPNWTLKQHSRICQAHFGQSEWLKFHVKLKPDAVPNIFLKRNEATPAPAVSSQSKEDNLHASIGFPFFTQTSRLLSSRSHRVSQPTLADILEREGSQVSTSTNNLTIPSMSSKSSSELPFHESFLLHDNLNNALDLISVNRQLQNQVIVLSKRLVAAEMELQRLRSMLL